MKRPKWSLMSIKEERDFDPEGSIQGVIAELGGYPDHAYIECNYDDYYGEYKKYTVRWWRDMTDKEYEREKKSRASRRAKKRAAVDRINEAQFKQYLTLKKKFEGE